MNRPLFPYALLTAAIVQALVACAHTDGVQQPADAPAPAQLADAPLPAAPALPASAAPGAPADAASAASAATAAQPILIRGNDRVINTSGAKNAGVGGPVSAFKFDNAPVAEVVKVMLGDLLKVDYVVHPPLAGNVTLGTRGQIPADRAMFLLEQALQASGIVLARDARGTYHVGTPESLQGIVSAPQVAGKGALPPGYGVIIVAPEYLGAGEVANILRPIIPAEAILRVDTLRNILVLRGTGAEAEGWLDIVKTFDINLLRGMSVGVFPLKHTTTADAENALRLLSGGVAAPAGGAAAAAGTAAGRAAPAGAANAANAAAGGTASLGENNPLFGALRIMPIERINALLVISPRAAYLDEVRYWIEQFDRPDLGSAEPQLFVYKVQNGSADHLSELLNGIYGGVSTTTQGASGATGVAPGLASVSGASGNVNASFAGQYGASRNSGTSPFSSGGFGATAGGTGFATSMGGASGSAGGGMALQAGGASVQGGQQGPSVTTTMLGPTVRVMADRINNTLLIHASPAEYARIEASLKRLDIQRAQVLLEATIVEVTLGDGLEYGLQWAFHGGVGGGRNNVGRLGGAAGVPGTSVTPGSSGAFTYTISNAAGNISAVLSALASKSLLKVISSPSLMVLDNHTAAIQVGTQEPVNTGSVINTNSNYTSTSIQYKDTGVMLGVTPAVNAGDLVTLDINQIVSSLSATASTTAGTSGYPRFLQRQINSKVSVRSGETIVLGGLIRDEAENRKSGLPLLSSIPVLGALFGTHNTRVDRTELLVIITPRVLRSDEDARAVSRELRQRMQGLTLPAPSH